MSEDLDFEFDVVNYCDVCDAEVSDKDMLAIDGYWYLCPECGDVEYETENTKNR